MGRYRELSGGINKERKGQVRSMCAGRRHILIWTKIDEDERLGALQHELVDGVECFFRKAVWMVYHEHVDFIVDLMNIGREGADLGELAQFLGVFFFFKQKTAYEIGQ